MNARALPARFGRVRWLVPAGLVVVAGVVAATVVESSPTRGHGLPDASAATLVAATRQASTTGFSGTVVSRVDLGLPPLDRGEDDAGTSLSSLLSGSHTLQVWYGGPGRERVTLLGAVHELDLFRSGQQVWTWDSAHRVATHGVLPAAPATSSTASTASSGSVPAATTPVARVPGLPAVLPGGLAAPVLAALDGSAAVRVEGHGEVADRPVYELVVTPHDPGTLVGSVRIAVDGTTKVPLAVQIYPKGSSEAAVDVSFTSIRLRTPPASYFTFSPPDGAQVAPMEPDVASVVGQALAGAGAGWTRVTQVRVGAGSAADTGALQALPEVSGTWGRGRLLETELVTVLITDDGRVFSGAVEPAEIYAAAAR